MLIYNDVSFAPKEEDILVEERKDQMVPFANRSIVGSDEEIAILSCSDVGSVALIFEPNPIVYVSESPTSAC